MNNLDQSSTGVNLELNVTYDNDLSQMWFDDTFENIYREGGSLINNYSRVNVYLYTQYGNISNDFDLADIENYNVKKCTVKALKDFLKDELGMDKSLVNSLIKSELLAEVVDFHSYNLDGLLLAFEVLDIIPLYSVISTRGYCQGDYAEIILPFELFDNKEPTKEELNSYKKEVDQLFWDQPIYINFNINDEEFCINEFLNDMYKYDQKEILQIVNDNLEHEKKAYIISWLEENLPSDPSYI